MDLMNSLCTRPVTRNSIEMIAACTVPAVAIIWLTGSTRFKSQRLSVVARSLSFVFVFCPSLCVLPFQKKIWGMSGDHKSGAGIEWDAAHFHRLFWSLELKTINCHDKTGNECTSQAHFNCSAALASIVRHGCSRHLSKPSCQRAWRMMSTSNRSMSRQSASPPAWKLQNPSCPFFL